MVPPSLFLKRNIVDFFLSILFNENIPRDVRGKEKFFKFL